MIPLEEFEWETNPEDIVLHDGTMAHVEFGDKLYGEWDDETLIFHFHTKAIH